MRKRMGIGYHGKSKEIHHYYTDDERVFKTTTEYVFLCSYSHIYYFSALPNSDLYKLGEEIIVIASLERYSGTGNSREEVLYFVTLKTKKDKGRDKSYWQPIKQTLVTKQSLGDIQLYIMGKEISAFCNTQDITINIGWKDESSEIKKSL